MSKGAIPQVGLITGVLLFLYTPIAVLVAMSFNSSRYNRLPFEFSTRWYQDLFANETLLAATRNSLLLALVTGILCIFLATMLVLSVHTFSRKWQRMIQSATLLPLTIPWLITGLSLLLLIRAFGLSKSLLFVLMGHVVIALPYSILVLMARMQSLDPALADASGSLGAGPVTTFRKVTLPVLAPAMVSGGALSFMISFDNFVISYFLMPSGFSTLPIEIQSAIKFGFTPEINAVSAIIIGISLLCLAISGGVIWRYLR